MISPSPPSRCCWVQAPRLGADLEHADVGGVVDVQRARRRAAGEAWRIFGHLLLGTRPLRSSSPLMRAWEATKRCASSASDISRREQRDRARPLLVQRGVLGDVRDQRALAHRRAGGDDDQVAGLEAAGDLVEVLEARRRAGERRCPRARACGACRSRRARTSSIARKSFWRSSWATSSIARSARSTSSRGGASWSVTLAWIS